MGNTLIACRSNEPIEAPGRIKLAPWGTFQSMTPTGHRVKSIMDSEAFSAMNAEFIRHGVDVPIDYEHQTLGGKYASQTGAAPAVGWIKRLHAVPGSGLFADVEWTVEGETRIKKKEYRYPSLAGYVRDSDHRLVKLHSVALTNTPAIDGMTPVVNSFHMPVADASFSRDPKAVIVAHRAGADWDANPGDQQLCSREDYIREALREEGLVSSKDARSLAIDAVVHAETVEAVGEEVRAITHRAGAEWDSSPKLRGPCTRDEYIQEAIREAGFSSSHGWNPSTIDGIAKVAAAGEMAPAISTVAHRAGSEWDSTPSLHGLCSREDYIKEALRTEGLTTKTGCFC